LLARRGRAYEATAKADLHTLWRVQRGYPPALHQQRTPSRRAGGQQGPPGWRRARAAGPLAQPCARPRRSAPSGSATCCSCRWPMWRPCCRPSPRRAARMCVPSPPPMRCAREDAPLCHTGSSACVHASGCACAAPDHRGCLPAGAQADLTRGVLCAWLADPSDIHRYLLPDLDPDAKPGEGGRADSPAVVTDAAWAAAVQEAVCKRHLVRACSASGSSAAVEV